MSSVRIHISMENSAFAESPKLELARILREAADKIEIGWDGGPLRDYNGNVVGSLVFD